MRPSESSSTVSWKRACAVGTLLLLAVTGCGSTSLRGGAAPAGAGGLDTPAEETPVLDGGETQSGGATSGAGAAVTSTGGAVGSSGTTTGSTGVVPGTSGGTTGTSGATTTTGTGVTAPGSKKPLRVGIYGADVTAIYAAFGKGDDAPSDPFSTYRAMVKYINAHGGIGGRQISLLTHTADSAGDGNTEGQKACQAFTQDNKVDVVFDTGGTPVLAACLKKAGVAMFSGNNYATDGVDTNAYTNWMMPSSMRIDRLMRSLIELSAARGTLKRGNKLGVMVDACPYGKRVYEGVIVPLAKQLGVSVVQSSLKCVENLVADLGPLTNDVQRAVLSFKTNNVTHVIGLHGAEAFVISNFTLNASQQHYLPKYLVTSNAYAWQNSQPQATIKISKDAQPNMSGVGFLPLLDVGPNAQFGAAQKQTQAMCTKADPTQFGAADDDAYHKPFAQNLFYSQCSGFFLMKDVIEAAGMRLDAQSVRAGFNLVKSNHAASAALTSGRLGGPASSTDGAGFVQAFAYDPNKTFVYVGSPQAVSS